MSVWWYTEVFEELVLEAGFHDPAILVPMFYKGLKWEVKQHLVGKSWDELTLAELKGLSITLNEERMNAKWHDQTLTMNQPQLANLSNLNWAPLVKVKMTHIRMPLSAEDWAQYMWEGQCFGCGRAGHCCPECPDGKPQANAAVIKPTVGSSNSKSQLKKLEWPKEHVAPVDGPWRRELHSVVLENTIVVSTITLYQLARLLTTLITLLDSIKMAAMVDSGAMGNFIHPRFISEHGLVTRGRTPLVVNDVNGWLLLHMDQQVKICMVLGGHSEMLTFDVALLGKHNIVLGLLWLQWHNLTIHWSSRKITFVSDYCEEHCLTQPASTFLNQRPIILMVLVESKVSEIAVEPLSEEEVDIFTVEILEHLESVAETILDPYHVKINVFNSQRVVTVLPPLRGLDVNFTIELDKSKLLPKPSHPYHMNQEECGMSETPWRQSKCRNNGAGQSEMSNCVIKSLYRSGVDTSNMKWQALINSWQGNS